MDGYRRALQRRRARAVSLARGVLARVLVVDDSPTIRKVVSAVLERHGFAALQAADGQAALDRLRANQPLDKGQLLGCEMTDRSLRFGLERSYRAQARLTSDRRRRTELVDLANDVRPSTWS